jgi:hypothetical protein
VFTAVLHVLEEGNLQYKGFVTNVTDKIVPAGIDGNMETKNEIKSKQILPYCS